MIFTARQLEEMHKNNGHVTLPYRARLTPLAQDWIRQKKIEVGYADVDTKTIASSETSAQSLAPSRPPGTQYLWWCDGPCGPAKAAIMAQSKESGIAELQIASEAGQIVPATKSMNPAPGRSAA